MQINKKVVSVEFFYSTFSSVFGLFGFTALFNLLDNCQVDLHFGGDKGPFFVGLFIGMPICNIGGILLADKKSLNIKRASIFSLFVAGIINLAGCLLALFMMDVIGGGILPIMYLATIYCSVTGCNINRNLSPRN